MGAKLDRRMAFAQQMVDKYGPQVAQFFHTAYVAPTGLSYGQLGGGRAAQAGYQADIKFDRNFLLNTSKQDLRGNIIHELSHVEGAGYGKPKASETLADLARYHFNFGDPNWKPSDQVLAAAERRGVTPVGQPNGPRQKPTTGRNRNTVVNNASHGAAPPPAISPSSAVAFGHQAAQLQLNYFQQLAAIKAQGGQLRADFRMAKAGAQQQAVSDMAHTEAAALDRGIVNSSIDLGARTGVIADRTAAIQQAIAARQAGRLGLNTARLNAANDYWTGVYDIQAQKAAQQAEMAAQALHDDQTIRAGDETIPGHHGAPPEATNPPPKRDPATGQYDATELFHYFMNQSGGNAAFAGQTVKNIMGERGTIPAETFAHGYQPGR